MNADLLYSDTEEALRDSVRHLLADRCPPEAVMRLYDPGPPDFSGVWKQLAADLGVAGLLVPEELGGAGAGAREAAVVMEEIGRPSPGAISVQRGARHRRAAAGRRHRNPAAPSGWRDHCGAGSAAIERAGRPSHRRQHRCGRSGRRGHQRRWRSRSRRAGGAGNRP
ncbi:acyl-CoA dehydrogenase, N-terminal domain protein [Mycobacterium xenopi 4042]|uniref:Acyl-CoA dehydrogenase, N-terminal domain protein n=1 Tax=Mycobacterium xenopi 4042 TaxID=1299334 RepID=X8CGZ4_MYCXE|nr:acyl-CoA dehydrogenase, N-terminal domain protein [Mycobacterium xenopi 4042]